MKITPRKVLLLDKEMLIQLAVAQSYRDSGPYFITASSAGEALNKMEIFAIDLFLLALDLQDPNSLQLLTIIEERFPGGPVVLLAKNSGEYCKLNKRIKLLKKHPRWQLLKKPSNLDVLTILIDKSLCELERETVFHHKGADGANKRDHTRSSIEQNIQFLLDVFDSVKRESKMVNATLTDLSAGGLGLETKHPLKMSQSVKFIDSSVGRSGVVAWSDWRADRLCRAGIRFC